MTGLDLALRRAPRPHPPFDRGDVAVAPSELAFVPAFEPAQELMLMGRERLQPALARKAPLARDKAGPAVQAAIVRLGNLEGRRVSFMPQLAWLIVDESDSERHFTVLHNNAHSNISRLFDEDKRRYRELNGQKAEAERKTEDVKKRPAKSMESTKASSSESR